MPRFVTVRIVPALFAGLLMAACGQGRERPGPGTDGPSTGGTAAGVMPPPAPQVLGPDECRDSGYLCPGLAERDEPRVLRWNAEAREIRIHVPLPALEPRSRARALQDAAVLGILAWQQQPFILRIQRNAPRGDADIAVRWVDDLGAMQLGRAETEWTRGGGGRMEMRVRSFTLAVLNPFEPAEPLEPVQVQLAAAHEMGHALGLPHSDSPRDIMYPTNTATALSPRDYETMAGLYRLENGAFLGTDALAEYRREAVR